LVCLPEGKIHVNSPHPREADSTSDSEPGEADGEAEPRASTSTAVRLEERVMALSCVELERTEAGHFRILLDFHI
jgi:hypothetical protein